MPITKGRSATTSQTVGDNYETAFDKNDGVEAELIELQCFTNGAIWRINGKFELLTQAGEIKYRTAKDGEGIWKIEVKRSGGQDGTVVWDADAKVPR